MIKKLIFFCLAIIFSAQVYGQKYSKRRAERLYHDGKYQESLLELNGVIGINSTDYIAYMDRAEVNRCLGKYDDALKDINTCMVLCPYNIKAYHIRSCIYFCMNEYEKGVFDEDYVISKSPMYSSGYNQRGLCYLCLNEYGKAKEDFDLAILYAKKSDSSVSALYSNRACVNSILGDYISALSDIDISLELFTDSPNDCALKIFILRELKDPSLNDFTECAKKFFPTNININILSLIIDIENADLKKVDNDIKVLKELNCNTVLFHRILKIYYLLIQDVEKYTEEVEILNHKELLEASFDLNFVMKIDPMFFIEKYGLLDPDIQLMWKTENKEKK